MLRSGPLFLILRYGFRGGQRSIADLSIAEYAEMWNLFALPCAVTHDLNRAEAHFYRFARFWPKRVSSELSVTPQQSPRSQIERALLLFGGRLNDPRREKDLARRRHNFRGPSSK
jgi:hypothetical protein